MSNIDLSPLDSAASTSVFSMFRDWNEKAVPNEKIHIKNEQLLVKNLKEAFRSAIAAIQKGRLGRQTTRLGCWVYHWVRKR